MGTGWKRRAVGLAALAVAAAVTWGLMEGPPRAEAQDGAMEASRLAQEVSLGKHAYLKRLSLDLTGTPPMWEQQEAIESESDVPDAVIDEMLESEGFLEVMRLYHRDLLWANVTNLQYIQFPWDLSRAAVGPPNDRHTVNYLRRKGVYFRGGPDDDENDVIPCHNLPATFGPDGRPEVTCDEETGRCLEGWVWVEPYWAPGTEVKVCAFDAQDSDYGSNGTTFCGSTASRRETSCGCGPNLRYCDVNVGGVNVQATIGASFGAQMLKIIEWVIENDRPYHEVLTTRMSFVNGPLAHFYRHQTGLAANVNLDPVPIDTVFLPEMSWDDPTWVPVLRGEEHSGVLTSYAFLLRFQTNRGRVNRFYNAFLDSYFDASKGVNAPDCVSDSADLTKMCGCQKCHVAVEPWAAHWARWKQQGGGFLPLGDYPVYDETCATCALNGVGSCPAYCRAEYVVTTVPADRAPYVGYLRGYEFLDEQHLINVDGGPRLWVERTIQDGSLAQGIVARMWVHFMRRPFTGSKADSEIRRDLTLRFIESGYSLKALVKAIVTHSAYRRIR